MNIFSIYTNEFQQPESRYSCRLWETCSIGKQGAMPREHLEENGMRETTSRGRSALNWWMLGRSTGLPLPSALSLMPRESLIHYELAIWHQTRSWTLPGFLGYQ